MRYTFSTTLLAVAGLSLVAVAQQPTASLPRRSVPGRDLQGRSELRRDRRAGRDAQGNFVRTLTRAIPVIEDGKPQALSVFSKVEIPIERAIRRSFEDRNRSDVSPTHADEGRLFVLVSTTSTHVQPDAAHSAGGAAIRRALHRRQRSGRGRQHLGHGSHPGFTSNRALALRAIDRAMGQKTDSSTSAALEDY